MQDSGLALANKQYYRVSENSAALLTVWIVPKPACRTRSRKNAAAPWAHARWPGRSIFPFPACCRRGRGSSIWGGTLPGVEIDQRPVDIKISDFDTVHIAPCLIESELPPDRNRSLWWNAGHGVAVTAGAAVVRLAADCPRVQVFVVVQHAVRMVSKSKFILRCSLLPAISRALSAYSGRPHR